MFSTPSFAFASRGRKGKCYVSFIVQMRQSTLSNDESKPKLGYHVSSNHLRCRAPPGPASTANRPNTTESLFEPILLN